MKVIISILENNVDSKVNPRFGRTEWLVLFNTEDGTHKILSNSGAQQSGGAGVAASQFVIDQGAEAVISGHFGPNAARALMAAGVKMYLFDEVNKSCKAMLESYLEGALEEQDHA